MQNDESNKGKGGLTKMVVIGLVILGCVDLLTSRGYRMKGGGSVGEGKDKKSAWIDARPEDTKRGQEE